MIGVFYTDESQAVEWVEKYKENNPTANIEVTTRRGVPYRVNSKHSLINTDYTWELNYQLHEIDNTASHRQGLCGIFFSSALFLGESTKRIDIVNYIMSRIRTNTTG